MIWLGFLCNALAVAIFQLVIVMPAEATWDAQVAYETVFGATPRSPLASMSAYLIGSLVNAYVLAR